MATSSDTLTSESYSGDLDPFSLSPIIPVVKVESLDQALPLADALMRGGISVVEITLRSDCAFQAMENIANEFPEM